MPKKSCSPWGRRPVKSAANQPMIAAKKTPIDHSPSQMRCGIASSSRKKTVRRERCEIVRDDQLHRMVGHGPESTMRARWR